MTELSRPVAPAELCDRLLGGVDALIAERAGRPVVAVDLRGPVESGVLREVVSRCVGAPFVLVGIADGAPASEVTSAVHELDVLLCADPHAPRPWVGVADPESELVALGSASEHSPAAAVALAQLLRVSEHTDVASAVIAESWVYSMLQSGTEHRTWLASRSDRRRRARPIGPTVRLERHGDRLEVTLDRPEVRNAFGAAMRDELVEAFTLVALDDSLVEVRLRGRGVNFCSGGDLDEFGTSPGPVPAHLVRTGRNAGVALSRVADRVVAEVHGTCVGAGVELPAFATRVEAAPGTTFRLPEIAMGLVPGAGGTASIPRRIGRHRTCHLALRGTELDVLTARDWGLVDVVRGHGSDAT